MRVLDLFSGIGGFSLGLERAGMKTVAFCEIDPYCRAVLRKHWPDVPVHEDIRKLDGTRISADLVCGGFPCQPFSHAGKRRGSEDDRHLWPQMCRVIAEVRPAWVVGENVPGIIGMELDNVLSDLEALGYATRTFVIPAAAVDARHRRDRIWVVGYADSDGESVMPKHAEASWVQSSVADSGRKCGADRRRDGDVAGSAGESEGDGTKREWDGHAADDCGADVAHAGGSRLEGRAEPSASRHAFGFAPGSRQQDGRWLPEPDVGRVAHGVPSRVDRLRALGNAVVPQIPEIIGRAIMNVDNQSA
jgi:DNA (cytosine-5)-methyltransferase 1